MWEYIFGGLGFLASVVTIITFIRSYLKESIGQMERRIDTLEERMFWLATGKRLEDAILEEKMKKSKIE